jgi:hypothetical protein
VRIKYEARNLQSSGLHTLHRLFGSVTAAKHILHFKMPNISLKLKQLFYYLSASFNQITIETQAMKNHP